MPEVIIVGGGLSGLSLAFRLHQRQPHWRLTILEKEERVGGNIWTDRRDGFQVEVGPNGFLDSKPSTMQLCRDLGLADRLIAASEGSRKNRYLFWQGALQLLPGSFWSFIGSPLLSWRGKINLLLEKYRHRPTAAPPDESIHDFAVRRAGRQTAEILADAMVTGIHSGDPKLLSVNAAFPRLVQFEKEHGSVTRGFTNVARLRRVEAIGRGEEPRPVTMWSFRQGLRLLVETLRDQCGATIVSGSSVKELHREMDRWIALGARGERWTSDAVVLTCQGPEQATQTACLDAELSREIAAIPYAKIAVVVVGYRQSDVPINPDGFGFIAPQATKRNLLGVQWCSSIFPERAPAGMVLYRALCGGWNNGGMVDWDDAALLSAVQAELRMAQQIKEAPVFTQVVRWPRAIPQYMLGHLGRVARIEERLKQHPGLFLGGNVYHGVAMNDCTEQAEILADKVSEFVLSTKREIG